MPLKLAILALALTCAAVSHGQTLDNSADDAIVNDWQTAQQIASTKRDLLIVTVDKPERRQKCNVISISTDDLVCARGSGRHRTYRTEQILAMILPGDGFLKFYLVAGLNVGLGTAIWGTVVLAAACPACAAATAFAALFFVCGAGAILTGDDQPDKLLYLAPGQHLTGKLRSLNP